MPVITLLSDWNTPNHYFAFVAGHIYSALPEINFVELSPPVKAHHISQAALILKNALNYFEAGSIHTVFVGMPDNNQKLVIGKYKEQYIISWDTGLLSLIDDIDKFEICVGLFPSKEGDKKWLTPITETAIRISNGATLCFEAFCEDLDILVLKQIHPMIQANAIFGNIISIDPYGNAVSNISKSMFEQYSVGKEFEIIVQSKSNSIDHISDGYNSDEMGDLIAVFNDDDLLEIAISHDNVSELLQLDTNSEIKVQFI